MLTSCSNSTKRSKMMGKFDIAEFYTEGGSWKRNVSFYFRRPIIYFCFGLPMGAPSICLIILSSVEKDLTATLIIGALLLALSATSLIIGITLGLRSCCRNRRADLVKEKQSLVASTDSILKSSSPINEKGGIRSSTHNGNINSMNARSNTSSPHSRRGSNSSSRSSITSIANGDKATLVKLKRTSRKRKQQQQMKGRNRKRGVNIQKDPLPPLEEESFVKSLSRGNTLADLINSERDQNGGGPTPRGAAPSDTALDTTPRSNGPNQNYEQLKEYLANLGLDNGHTHPIQCKPVGDVDKQSRSASPPLRHVDQPQFSRDPTRRSISPPRQNYSSVVTSSSHERTGIRLP